VQHPIEERSAQRQHHAGVQELLAESILGPAKQYYMRRAYPAVLKALEKVAEGTPEIQTYEVANSTFHKIATKVVVM